MILPDSCDVPQVSDEAMKYAQSPSASRSVTSLYRFPDSLQTITNWRYSCDKGAERDFTHVIDCRVEFGEIGCSSLSSSECQASVDALETRSGLPLDLKISNESVGPADLLFLNAAEALRYSLRIVLRGADIADGAVSLSNDVA